MNWEKHNINLREIRGGKGFCPKCHHDRKNKRDRSLSVDRTTGLFNCHHCGFKGCAAEREKPEYVPQRTYRKPTARTKKPDSRLVEWFKGRGISEATVNKAGVTESTEYMPQVNGERNCICFPYFRSGELVNIKYRDGEKHFKLEKDAELIFFGLDTVTDETESIIITEGEIDALTVMECGLTSGVLSVPNGASKGNQRLEYLDNCWQHLEAVSDVIIATDGDLPGLMLKDELARRLGPERCYFLVYPDGCKDLNEVLTKLGKVAVLETIRNAKPFPLDAVETADDLDPEVWDIVQHGYPEGLKAGWSEFDQLLRFNETGFTVLTGIPGHGKSTFLNNLAIRMADRHGWRFGMFTPEMQPNRFLVAQLIELISGKGIREIQREEYDKAIRWVADHFYLMKIDEMDITIEGILAKAAQMVKFYGINALVIDPFNYIDVAHNTKKAETTYISEMLTKIKIFKDKYKVHVFLVAHPTKISKNATGGFMVPTLYDIAGSAHFKNKMDNGIVVFKDDEKGTTEILILKVRWWFFGHKGSTSMFYDKHTRRFSESSSNQFPCTTDSTNGKLSIPIF